MEGWINQNDISRKILKFLLNFIICGKQKLLLNGYLASENVNLGVAQSCVIGPLLFLIYIKHLSNRVFSVCKLFADKVFFYFQWSVTFK